MWTLSIPRTGRQSHLRLSRSLSRHTRPVCLHGLSRTTGGRPTAVTAATSVWRLSLPWSCQTHRLLIRAQAVTAVTTLDQAAATLAVPMIPGPAVSMAAPLAGAARTVAGLDESADTGRPIGW